MTSTSALTVTRNCPGSYRLTNGAYAVKITRADEGPWRGEWVAAAEWDGMRYTDPLPTYGEAKIAAVRMIETANDF